MSDPPLSEIQKENGTLWTTLKILTLDEIKEPEEKCVMEEEHKEQTNITMEVQEPVISENERRKRLREILRLVAQKLRQKEIVYFVLSKVGDVWFTQSPTSMTHFVAYVRGDSMIFKNIEKVMGLQQPAGRDYVLSIE